MAFINLGSVKIVNATIVNLSGDETYNDGDKIYVYLNDATDSVVAYLNPSDPLDPSTGTLQTGGNFITQIMVNEGNAIVKSSRYSVCDGTNLIRYYKEGAVYWDADFPYFSANVDIDSPACSVSPPVCDLSGFVTSSTNPSSSTATDGSISITATSTDSTGVQFNLSEFEYGNGFQATRSIFPNAFGQYTYTYTFSGLSQGTYTIYAKDDLGCSFTYNDTVLNGTQAAASYGTRFRAEFTDDGNTTVSPTTHDHYRVVIKEKNYTDASAEITYMSGEPLIITTGSGGAKYSPVKGSRIDFKIKSVTNNQYTSVFFGGNDRTISDGSIIIEVYQNDTLIKKGYFLSDGYSEPYMDAPYDISLRFIDGLADLSSRLYQNISGLDSSFNVILSCLREIKLPDMRLRVLSDTYPDTDYDASGNLTADASACSFMSAYVDRQSYEGLTYRDVLEGVLQSTPEPMTIRSEGNYFIVQPEVLDASAYNYADYDLNGNYEASGVFNPYKDEGKIRSGNDMSLSGNMTRDSVYKKIKVVEDRVVKDTIFNTFSLENIEGEKVDEDILGTGFYGFNNVPNGDSGSFFVKKVFIRNDRPETKLIQSFTTTRAITRPDSRYTANGYDTYSIEEDNGFIVNTITRKSDIGRNFRETISDQYFLIYSFNENQQADAYVTSSSNIESDEEDDFEFSFQYFINISDALYKNSSQPDEPLYLKLRYSVTIYDLDSGDTYSLNGTDWQLNSVSPDILNERFVSEYYTIQNFSITGKMPVSSDNCRVNIKVYDVDVLFRDVVSRQELYNVDASGLPEGYRLIVGEGNGTADDPYSDRGYYVLTTDDTTDGITVNANNKSGFVWRQEALKRLNFSGNNPNPEYGVTNISFKTMPNGVPFSDSFKEENSISSDNIYDLEYPVFHFNVRGGQTNEKGMLLNYWRDASGSPLSGWGADDELSQSIILKELLGQYRNPSQKININARYFSQVNATNTIRITYDSNRLFKFNSYTWMPKSRMITGEIVEIGIAGQEISIGEYSSAFNTAFNI